MSARPVRPDAEQFATRIHQSGITASLVVTGGGSSVITWLLARPGASRTVIEAEVPYSEAALARYLGRVPGKMVSRESAMCLAERAFTRSIRLGASPDRAAGVACTAALATDRARRGDEQAFVAVRTADRCVIFHLRFEKGHLSRAKQEEVVGRVALNAVGRAAGLTPLPVSMAGIAALDEDHLGCGSLLDDLAAGRGEVVVVESDGRMHCDPGHVKALLAASLNPLHAGHLAMAEAAERHLRRRVDFELALVNADKSPISPHKALARIQSSAWRRRTLATRAPTFVEKARLFPGCCFVVGYDTATRIVEERFYGGGQAMLQALAEVRERGCGFLVGGRLQDGLFLGVDAVPIPAGYEDLFDGIPERAFREDISSTAIRTALRNRHRAS